MKVHRKMQEDGAYARSSAASALLRWRMSSANSTSSAMRSAGVNRHSRSSARNSSMVSTIMIASPVEGSGPRLAAEPISWSFSPGSAETRSVAGLPHLRLRSGWRRSEPGSSDRPA